MKLLFVPIATDVHFDHLIKVMVAYAFTLM